MEDVDYLVTQYPALDRCKVDKGAEIFVKKGSGFMNPYNHIRIRIADGIEEELCKLYTVSLQA